MQHNIDDALADAMAAQMTPTVPQGNNVPRGTSNDTTIQPVEKKEEIEDFEEEISEEENDDTPEPESEEESADKNLDEYGNEIPVQESKTYTEEEVNERINKAIRERLARMERNAKPEQQAAITEAKKNFEVDPHSEDDWQAQLSEFIERTLETREQRARAIQRQQAEEHARIEFEEKFFQGMGKFRDFREVVGGQPITDEMMGATRAMKDPAAFLYAASKQHPSELARIAKINDPYVQVAEIGKLEERMKKNKSVTKAPVPVSHTKGDATRAAAKPKPKHTNNIDELIRQETEKRLTKQNAGRGR
jgi:hypothetical protein